MKWDSVEGKSKKGYLLSDTFLNHLFSKAWIEKCNQGGNLSIAVS